MRRRRLIQAFYFWGLSREDVDLALTGKYGEIVFPGDDASPVAEQTPTPSEVVYLRGKVIEMEKALSRARDFINCTQQDKRFVDESDKLECQRSLLSLTLYFEAEVDSEQGLKKAYLELLTEIGIVSDPAQGQRAMRIIFFNIKKEDIKIHAQLEIDLRHACDKLERCKGHNACLEREKVECASLFQSSEKRVTLLEARLLNAQQRLQVSQSRLKKKITPKRGKHAIKTDHERYEIGDLSMMSRPMVLVFLLLILIITSQFEWKQQLANEIEATPILSQKPQHSSSREEVVKEKLTTKSSKRNLRKLAYVLL
ncbi:hypothetical protein GIB67_013699 [Kingdonia uniflora]|uniref:Uncharacterized protein n=1 Tax=Kingdonia uniflora TaxID=39325 RepID=A0A7J7NQ21_9MAGN|nr:hypothetical protein GIB67_013699 [Kingdonia uniflora]